jgi:DivIVA domain-containing protein
MPEERLVSITSSLHLAPDDVARHTFGSVRRGFDPNEVRAYLESVALGLRTVAEREEELLKALADAEHRAANPVLDEPTLTAALGSETARVLHSAHEVAAEMVAKAEAEANRLLTEAREEIDHNRSTTEAALQERSEAIEASAKELQERTDQQVAAGLDKARLEAEALLSEAREQCRAMVDEAQGLRARVLADLAKRRKVLHAQIEQLRAGRERLAETVQDVRRSIDVIADELFTAEDNARLAAENAGRESLARSDDGTPEELAAELLAGEAESDARRAAVAGPELAHDLDMAIGTVGVEVVEMLEDGPAGETHTTDGPDGGHPPPEESVDALFAKLRAASSDPGEPADVAPAASGEAVEPAPEDAAGSGPAPSDGGAIEEVAAAEVAEDPTAEVAAEESESTDAADEEPPAERHPSAVRRDELIEPIVKALSRRLKRTLQDSQNELLDALRSKGFEWSPDLLPDETEHVDSYVTAALPALEQAAAAGLSFAGAAKSPSPHTDVLVGIGHDLAESVVGPIRRRLLDGAGLDGAEESVVADHVGSAFREWKGERIERLAGDHVVAAFSEGTIAAAQRTSKAQLEWVAVSDSGDAPCPD